MNDDNSTNLPTDHGKRADAPVTHEEAKRLPRWGRLILRPRVAAAFALVAVLGLNASGAFGLNVLGMHSALTATSLAGNFQSAAGATYQITPTGTTCQQFGSQTSSTLSSINYSVKGSTINQVNPGVFFYWVKVTSTPGSNTFTITQAVTNPPTFGSQTAFFTQAAGSNVYDANCNPVKGSTITYNSTTGSVSVAFTSSTGASTFYIGTKYNTGSVVGAKPPSGPGTATYTFDTLKGNMDLGTTASIILSKK
jgi:hypothetical protein